MERPTTVQTLLWGGSGGSQLAGSLVPILAQGGTLTSSAQRQRCSAGRWTTARAGQLGRAERAGARPGLWVACP